LWGPTWLEIRWNSIWLKAWSHVTSQYTWGYVTTLHGFGGVLERSLDTFFWALTITARDSCAKWPWVWDITGWSSRLQGNY
jgi:hypothetical protein